MILSRIRPAITNGMTGFDTIFNDMLPGYPSPTRLQGSIVPRRRRSPKFAALATSCRPARWYRWYRHLASASRLSDPTWRTLRTVSPLTGEEAAPSYGMNCTSPVVRRLTAIFSPHLGAREPIDQSWMISMLEGASISVAISPVLVRWWRRRRGP